MASGADVTEWINECHCGHWNLAIRLPETVIGLDVDAYDGKPGEETMLARIDELGDLPKAPRSSSRPDDKVSGIRFYRVPTLAGAVASRTQDAAGCVGPTIALLSRALQRAATRSAIGSGSASHWAGKRSTGSGVTHCNRLPSARRELVSARPRGGARGASRFHTVTQ